MALDLWTLARELRACRFVDLTHAFDTSIPHSPFFEPEERSVLYDHAPAHGSSGQGFLAHRYSFVGQWGTHVDPGAHFVAGRRFLDEIPVSEMVLPLVVLDIRKQVATDDDYCLTVEDVLNWEERHGRMPRGAFVAQRSGWSSRWPDKARMANRDANGVAHFPGWTLNALRLIFEERSAMACGHETLDTDGGVAVSRGDGALERYILERDRWQIELMANLDQLPEAGALIVATWPKPKRGSGFPARVFAIVSQA